MIKKLVALLLHTGLSRIAAMCASFMLTFVLARSFTPEQYGVYGLIATAMWVLTPLGGLSISSYVNRAVPGREPVEQVGILKVTLLSELVLAVIIGTVLVWSGMVRLFVSWTHTEEHYAVFVGVICLMVANAVQTELAQFAYAKTRVQIANYMDLLMQSAWVPVLLLLSLTGHSVGVGLVLTLMITGSVASSILGSSLVDWRAFWAAHFDRRLLAVALMYSVPLIVPSMNYGLLRFADRAFLASMTDMREMGLYVFAGSLVNLIFTLSYRILTATIYPFIVQAHNQDKFEERDLLLTYVLKASLGAFILGVVVLRGGAYWPLLHYVRPEYMSSVHWIGWVAVTNVLLIMNYPGQTLLMLQNRTRLIMVIETIGLVVVIGLSMLLIPRFGIFGGVLASWGAWGFVAVTEGLAADARHVIRWRQFWTFESERRMARALVADFRSRGAASGSSPR